MTDDEVIICDPEAEYTALVNCFEGQVIKISPTSTQYINPMDINESYSEEDNPLALKADFILSLCELIVGGKEGLQPIEKTVIDRCVHRIYQKYFEDPKPKNMPLLEDLYNALLMRHKFDEISLHMEEKMGHPFFCCDAVLDSKSRQIAIYSGYAKEMMPESWKLADQRTYVHWAEKKYDILVFSMPQKFHYGDGMGTNPVMMMQALSAQVLRYKRVMSDHCVIICSSLCNGFFNDSRWPYLRELYDIFQHDRMNQLPDMNRLGEYFAINEEYIRKYCFANAFHPFHGFSMMSCGHIAEMNTSAIYIVGAQDPGYARGMDSKRERLLRRRFRTR